MTGRGQPTDGSRAVRGQPAYNPLFLMNRHGHVIGRIAHGQSADSRWTAHRQPPNLLTLGPRPSWFAFVLTNWVYIKHCPQIFVPIGCPWRFVMKIVHGLSATARGLVVGCPWTVVGCSRAVRGIYFPWIFIQNSVGGLSADCPRAIRGLRVGYP